MAQTVPATEFPASADDPVRLRIACCWLAGCGLALVIVGSFLPWVVSGTVRRSSYAIAGVVDRLGIAGDGPLAVLIAGWPFVGVLCFAPVVAAALRRWRTSGVLAAVIGLVAALLSLAILLLGLGRSGLSVQLDPLGPTVMAAGGLLLLGGGLCLALGVGSPVRRRGGRSPGPNQS